MSRRKENSRIITFRKLSRIKKTDKKEILNLKLEDLKDIIENRDFQNILLLRKYLKEDNVTKYFDDSDDDKLQ